jgi:hypothetical protein
MDAAPRGLAPGGPGATGAPLLDCVLCDPGLAGVVFAHLVPRDVLGLRAASKAACAAVAGHGWASTAAHAWEYSQPVRPLGDRVRSAAAGQVSPVYASPAGLNANDVSGGAAALGRWRACFPLARSVVVRHAPAATDDAVTDANVAALVAAGCGSRLTLLGLVGCSALTDAAFAPPSRLTSLLLMSCSLTGACWGALAGRLRSVATDGIVVTDDHLPALSGCSHVALGEGASVSDAGVAAHLAPRVTHLLLDATDCDGFDGSCLRGCARLVKLQLTDGAADGPVRRLLPDALAGCAAHLTSLELQCVDGGDALFTGGGGGGGGGLPALRHAIVIGLPSLTDAAFTGATTPALADLTVMQCGGIVGGPGLGALPGLASLVVRECDAFTGRGLTTGGATPALEWLAVHELG